MYKKFLYHILLCLSFVSFNIYAIIFEGNKISDVDKYIDKDSIVVIDIDNTIARVVPPGIEPWITYKTFELKKKGLNHKEAFDLVLCMFMIISKATKLLPIGNSPAFIQKLQKRNIPTIALTNRSIPIINRTIKRLKKIGIDFSKNSLYHSDMNLELTHAAKYSHGIIFTGSNDKGKMLFLFFKKIGYTPPKKIIFINDRMKNVKSVEKATEEHNRKFIGLRINIMDKEKEEFDAIATEKSICELKKQLGFDPLYKTSKNTHNNPNWLEYIWAIVIWPLQKMLTLFF